MTGESSCDTDAVNNKTLNSVAAYYCIWLQYHNQEYVSQNNNTCAYLLSYACRYMIDYRSAIVLGRLEINIEKGKDIYLGLMCVVNIGCFYTIKVEPSYVLQGMQVPAWLDLMREI